MSLFWKCGFCNETHNNHFKMQRHESKCPSNPENRVCFSCINFMPGVKTCKESMMAFNVYTSGISCDRWTQKQKVEVLRSE